MSICAPFPVIALFAYLIAAALSSIVTTLIPVMVKHLNNFNHPYYSAGTNSSTDKVYRVFLKGVEPGLCPSGEGMLDAIHDIIMLTFLLSEGGLNKEI